MENNKGQTIFLSVIGIATLLVAIVGATFAWFSTTIEGNQAGNTTSVTAVQMAKVVFSQSSATSLTDGYPNETATTEFTITAPDFKSADDNATIDYIVNVSNSGTMLWNPAANEGAGAAVAQAGDLSYYLTCEHTSGDLTGTGASIATTGLVATSAEAVAGTTDVAGNNNGSLKSEEVHTCTYTLKINETGNDQNYLQGLTATSTITVVIDEETSRFTAGGANYSDPVQP